MILAAPHQPPPICGSETPARYIASRDVREGDFRSDFERCQRNEDAHGQNESTSLFRRAFRDAAGWASGSPNGGATRSRRRSDCLNDSNADMKGRTGVAKYERRDVAGRAGHNLRNGPERVGHECRVSRSSVRDPRVPAVIAVQFIGVSIVRSDVCRAFGHVVVWSRRVDWDRSIALQSAALTGTSP
jgi:hypothetical protein